MVHNSYHTIGSIPPKDRTIVRVNKRMMVQRQRMD